MGIKMVHQIAPHTSLNGYFHQEVRVALFRQNIQTTEHVEYYLVNLLAVFAQELNQVDSPLAILFLDSITTPDAPKRYRQLKQLGDFALLVSGYFSDSLKRKLVDVDYYIGLGSNAYQALSSISINISAFQQTFEELGDQFPRYVDVLSEISENSGMQNNSDLLRLYEKYLKTGSERLKTKLQEAGIPVTTQNPLRDVH